MSRGKRQWFNKYHRRCIVTIDNPVEKSLSSVYIRKKSEFREMYLSLRDVEPYECGDFMRPHDWCVRGVTDEGEIVEMYRRYRPPKEPRRNSR